MRLAIMGDMQYGKEGLRDVLSAFHDINLLKPDVVVFLGDYGCGKDFGTPKAILEVAAAAKTLDVPRVIPIIGNHDLQLETGNNRYPHSTIATVFCEAYSLDSVYNVIEYEGFRLFLFGLEPLPIDDPFEYPVAENYLSDETMDYLERKLNERPGIPVIMATHAQPICGGLRLVPDVHIRAQNAYLNGHHNPERWTELIKRHPQIIMWFCGHYHLGHFQNGSHSRRYGVDFFLSGVVTDGSRDGTRHTRIVDITETATKVSTFDHISKKLTVDKEYGCFIAEIPQKCDAKKTYPINWQDDFGNIISLTPMGDATYVQTDDGRIFEIDNKNSAIVGMGTYSTIKEYLGRTDFYG